MMKILFMKVVPKHLKNSIDFRELNCIKKSDRPWVAELESRRQSTPE